MNARYNTSKLALLLAVVLGITACTLGRPEGSNEVSADTWKPGAMASAANPHAVDAAVAMLARGGHAVDAVIAAHAVLGLVEPQSSGIGGGAFMLVYQRDRNQLKFHDGRDLAPAGATVDMFMRDGKVMGFVEAWQSGTAIAVPGAIALYEDTHKKYGKLPWAELFQPAIQLASQGFEVSPRLANYLPKMAKMIRLDEDPASAAYFYPDGAPLKAGHLLKNPAYAATLTRISTEGASAFYTGSIARSMVAAAQSEPEPGTLSMEDLAGYSSVEREAVCGPFRELTLCGPTPPSSAAAQIMMMGLYDRLVSADASQADKYAAFVDAQRMGYADRDHYFGDPDFVEVPVDALISPQYLDHRAADRLPATATPAHGDPVAVTGGMAALSRFGEDRTQDMPGTSHLSIIDNEGNAVSMTATVEAPFGSARMVEGFLLNNQMTDFSREYHAGQVPQANAIAPGKRPRSSMSPIMVFDQQGKMLLVTGSPGGNSIPAYVFKSLVGILDWGLTPQQAVAFPNIVARGNAVKVEVATEEGQRIADDLAARGYTVQEREGENSGLQLILVSGDTLVGAADPRREGTVGSP